MRLQPSGAGEEDISVIVKANFQDQWALPHQVIRKLSAQR